MNSSAARCCSDRRTSRASRTARSTISTIRRSRMAWTPSRRHRRCRCSTLARRPRFISNRAAPVSRRCARFFHLPPYVMSFALLAAADCSRKLILGQKKTLRCNFFRHLTLNCASEQVKKRGGNIGAQTKQRRALTNFLSHSPPTCTADATITASPTRT